MFLFLLRRIFLIPIALLLVHMVGFAFAYYTYQFQQSQTIYGSAQEEMSPFWPAYQEYLRNAMRGDFGDMPVGLNETIAATIGRASVGSLGLILVAFGVSIVAGLLLGLGSVRVDPPRSAPWLPFVSTLGLAVPSFTIGIIFIAGLLFLSIQGDQEPFLPVSGFGWDIHLLLPVLALALRPTMQIAMVSANLLYDELGKRYVTASRSFGHSWKAICWDKALKNILAPVIMVMAGSFRLLVVELLLVEWLFSWPGLGRQLVLTLVPPRLSGIGGLLDTSIFFLNPPLVAGLLVVFALLFLLVDTIASTLAQVFDPRLRTAEAEVTND